MQITRPVLAMLLLTSGLLAAQANAAPAPATQQVDAAELFLQAARAIAVEMPASSNLEYPGYPPFGKDWDDMAAAAFASDGLTRQLARQARSSDRAAWPDGADLTYLGLCRNLANQLGDTALYQHLHGEDAAAMQTIRDGLHLSRMIAKNPKQNDLVRPIVAAGIDDLATFRILIIAPGMKLTKDPANVRAEQVADAHLLIKELLEQKEPATLLKEVLGPQFEKLNGPEFSTLRTIEAFNRCNAARTFAAMSLACQLVRADLNHWPATVQEMIPAYLPRLPIDPWGDGKQTFGYALIEHGLPDGSDRPLVYSRCYSQDGLFFRIDEPQYGFYVQDGSKLPSNEQKHGGQFRDVARWIPPRPPAGPTTQPLR